MKKAQKIIFLIIGLFTFFLALKKVNAENTEQFYEGEWIPNIYINKVTENGYKKYQQALVVRRKSDNQYAYCLEPFTKLKSDVFYNKFQDGYSYELPFNRKEWNRINLLSYYGYMYKGHEDIKWYAITQVLIWQTVNPSYDIYFTDSLNGKRKTGAFQAEITELESLITKHNQNISFLNNNINLNIGEKISLVDQNNLLEDFKIIKSTLPATIANNTLTLEGTAIGSQTITLEKSDNLYSNKPLIYKEDSSQNVLIAGSYEPVTVNLNINVNGYALKIQKIDKDTFKPIKKSGLKFKIKNLATNDYLENTNNSTDKYVFVTNDDGYFITPNTLEYGKYAILEEDNQLSGYVWNQEPLVIELNEENNYLKDANNNLYVEIPFANERITGKIMVTKLGEIFKHEESNFNYEFQNLKDITIGLYAKTAITDINGTIIYHENELIASKKTNAKGSLVFDNLYLGEYYLREINTNENYLLDSNKYFITLKEEGTTSEIIKEISLKNYLKKGNVIITKTSSLTNEPLANTKIGLFNADDELIYTGITDEEGKITINDLPLGQYYLKEIEAPNDYVKNEEKINFSLTSDGEIMYIEVTNNPLITIPDTYSHKNWTVEIMTLIESLIVICFIQKRKVLNF